jgi:hypothetical protein
MRGPVIVEALGNLIRFALSPAHGGDAGPRPHGPRE